MAKNSNDAVIVVGNKVVRTTPEAISLLVASAVALLLTNESSNVEPKVAWHEHHKGNAIPKRVRDDGYSLLLQLAEASPKIKTRFDQ